MAGTLRVVRQLCSRCAFPNARLRKINPILRGFGAMDETLSKQANPFWKSELTSRETGISAFGYVGTLAHATLSVVSARLLDEKKAQRWVA